MSKPKKKYRVEVAYQGEKYYTVIATSEASARSVAEHKAMKAGIPRRDIRRDWTNVVNEEEI